MRPQVKMLVFVVVLLLTPAAVSAAQNSATTSAPNVVKEGQSIVIRILLNRPPNVDGGVVGLEIINPKGAGSELNVAVGRDQTTVAKNYLIPVGAPSGKWRIKVTKFQAGNKISELKSEETVFEVEQKKEVSLPTAAKVDVIHNREH
jgi:hypothetical protein